MPESYVQLTWDFNYFSGDTVTLNRGGKFDCDRTYSQRCSAVLKTSKGARMCVDATDNCDDHVDGAD